MPHRGVGGHAIEHPGQNAKSMWATEKKVVCLFNVAPESDSLYGQDILTALQSAHCVIACTSYANETMQAVADILLPVASVGESSGSCINAEGQEKVFASAADLPGYARPAWKVFRALGSTMQLSGFDHMTLDDVRDAMGAALTPGRKGKVMIKP